MLRERDFGRRPGESERGHGCFVGDQPDFQSFVVAPLHATLPKDYRVILPGQETLLRQAQGTGVEEAGDGVAGEVRDHEPDDATEDAAELRRMSQQRHW